MADRSQRFVAYLIYVTAVLMGMVWVVAVFIVPKLAELVMGISNGQQPLPQSAIVVFNVSAFIQNNGMLFGLAWIFLLAGSVFCRFALRKSRGRH